MRQVLHTCDGLDSHAPRVRSAAHSPLSGGRALALTLSLTLSLAVSHGLVERSPGGATAQLGKIEDLDQNDNIKPHTKPAVAIATRLLMILSDS